jgi:hypothetical protein
MTTDPDQAMQRLLDANPDLVERIVRMARTKTGFSIELAPIRQSLFDLAEWAVRYGGAIVGGTRGGPADARCGAWKVVFDIDGWRVALTLRLSLAEAATVLFSGDCA